MPTPNPLLLAFLYRALKCDQGLAIATPTPSRTMMELNQAKAMDSELSPLRIVPSRTNPAGEVWILHKESLDAQE